MYACVADPDLVLSQVAVGVRGRRQFQDRQKIVKEARGCRQGGNQLSEGPEAVGGSMCPQSEGRLSERTEAKNVAITKLDSSIKENQKSRAETVQGKSKLLKPSCHSSAAAKVLSPM